MGLMRDFVNGKKNGAWKFYTEKGEKENCHEIMIQSCISNVPYVLDTASLLGDMGLA